MFHDGMCWVGGLAPAPAFTEELAAHAGEAGRWIKLGTTQFLVIGVHEVKQAVFLLFGHGRKVGDAEFGALQFNQVMQLDAGFPFARVVTVEDGVAAHLKFMQVFDRGGVGGGGTRLEVDDGAFLNKIEDADEAGKTMLGKIGFHGHFHGVGFDGRHRTALPDVGVTKTPARGLFLFFLTGLPKNHTFGDVRPCLGVCVVQFPERERFIKPSALAPCLQRGMNRIADMKGGGLGLLDTEDVAKVELQPTLQKEAQPRS